MGLRGRKAGAELTGVQSRVLGRWYGALRDEGRMMSFREIQEEFGWGSTNAVVGVVGQLERLGYIGRGARRGVRFLRRPDGSKFEGFLDKV